MSPAWEDLAARARGLEGRLLGRAALERMAAAGEPGLFLRALRDTDYGAVPLPERPGTADVDLAVRRLAAARLRLLARRAGGRARTLAVILEDEDRRSVRALLRGAVGGGPSEQRLAGLLPTPSLPEAVLEELAALGTTGEIAGMLVAVGSPYGRPLLPEARSARPDLAALERALSRTWAARSVRSARGTGTDLCDYVRMVIDAENAVEAISTARAGEGPGAGDASFLTGGGLIDPGVFRAARRAEDAQAASRVLSPSLSRTPLAGLVRTGAEGRGSMEDAVLRGLLREWSRRARLRPLGPAPVLLFVLRLRAEVIDLRRILWSAVLGVAPAAVAAQLVSP